VISIDSLTVIGMAAVSAFFTVRVRRRSATVAMTGLTGLLAALWLGEYTSITAADVVAIVSLVILTTGLAGMAVSRFRREASTPRARRTRPRRARGRR
jgi:uncharacterized MnhB-related membrane protein